MRNDAESKQEQKRRAEGMVVDGLLATAMSEVEDDLAQTQIDLKSASRESHKLADVAKKLNLNEKRLSEERQTVRDLRDKVDALEEKLRVLTSTASEGDGADAGQSSKQRRSSTASQPASTSTRATQTVTPPSEQKILPPAMHPAQAAKEQGSEAVRSREHMHKSRLGLTVPSKGPSDLKQPLCRKAFGEVIESRLLHTLEDDDSLWDTALDAIQDMHIHRYGLASLAQKNSARMLLSVKKHADSDSATLSLFSRLAGMSEPALGLVPFNLAVEAARVLAAQGLSPTSDEAELDFETMRAVTTDLTLPSVAEAIDYDAWWIALTQQRAQQHQPRAPQPTASSSSQEPTALVADFLSFVCEELADIEEPVFKRMIAPLLSAADIDGDGFVSRRELAALVRVLSPSAAEKTVTRIYSELQRAAAGHARGEGEAMEEYQLASEGVDIKDVNVVCAALLPCGLRRLLRHSPLAVDSPLLSLSAVHPGPRPALLPGSVALAQVEELWAANADDVRTVAGNTALPDSEQVSIASRIERFEHMLTDLRARAAPDGDGTRRVSFAGSDETPLAAAFYAHTMLLMETTRLKIVNERGVDARRH